MYEPMKRVIDIVGAIVAIMLFAPAFIGVIAAIKILTPGPIFAEMPPRVGKNGRLFHMYKFRSMVQNAHYLLLTDPKFKELYEEYKRNSYKILEDPRVTTLGRFLRKTSLDEIPQFFNVLKGDMSLIGPRAYFPDELKEQQIVYPQTKPLVKLLLEVKPGITGLWQVSGRSKINFDKRIELDAEYARNFSFMLDFKILLKTLPTMLSGKGAV